MTEHHADPGSGPRGGADRAKKDVEAAQAKQAAAQAEAEAKRAQQRAEEVEEKARDDAEEADEAASGDETEAKETSDDAPEPTPEAEADDAEEAEADDAEEAEADDAEEAEADDAEEAEEEESEELEVVQKEIRPKQKPELDDERKAALELRSAKKAKQPTWRRQEWFRYKKLGGKGAPWRSPRGMHSKQRMHLKYRQNVVSVGYRGPVAARGLHPSGFEEVLVYRPEDLAELDAKTQAARVGGTVGGRKGELIETEADKLGIRVLNRRHS